MLYQLSYLAGARVYTRAVRRAKGVATGTPGAVPIRSRWTATTAPGYLPASMPPQAPRGARRADVLWYAAAALTSWSFGYAPVRAGDLWWHLASGRWIVAHHAVAAYDPFGYTSAGRAWVDDAWLSDALLCLWSRAFGLESLAVWKWAALVAGWLLLFRLLVRLSDSYLAGYVAATVGLAVAAPFLDVRPQLVALPCWALVLEGTVGRRPAAWLPLVLAAWANLHASFALGLLTLPLVLAPALRDGSERRRTLVLGALSVGATLLTPYGSQGIARPLLHALAPGFRGIAEWLPPFEPGGIHSWLYPYGIATFAGATSALAADPQRRRSAETWVAIAVGALVLAMSLRSRRFVPLFGMGSTLALALALARPAAALGRRMPALLPPLAALGLAGWWLAPYPKGLAAFHYLTEDFEFPVDTLDFVEANRLGGNVFAFYGWGGYVDWRTDGRLRVFIDGRGETAFGDETLARYLDVANRRPGWTDVVDRSGADFVLWPRWELADVAETLVHAGHWRVVHEDYTSRLLVRDSVPLPATLTAPPDSPFRSLAAGMAALQASRFDDARTQLAEALDRAPDLQPACVLLAQVEQLAGNPRAAHATAARCRAAFPDARRDAQLAATLRTLRSAPAGR